MNNYTAIISIIDQLIEWKNTLFYSNVEGFNKPLVFSRWIYSCGWQHRCTKATYNQIKEYWPGFLQAEDF